MLHVADGIFIPLEYLSFIDGWYSYSSVSESLIFALRLVQTLDLASQCWIGLQENAWL